MCYTLSRRDWFSNMGEIQKRDAKFKVTTGVSLCVYVCYFLSSGMAYLDIKGKATTVAANILQQSRVKRNF